MAKVYRVTNPLGDFQLSRKILNSTLVRNGIDNYEISYDEDNEDWLVQIDAKQNLVLEENDYLLGGLRNNVQYCLHFSPPQGAQPPLSGTFKKKVSDDQPFCSGATGYHPNTKRKMSIDIDDQDNTVLVKNVPNDMELDFLKMFLEDEKLSGGGKIRRFMKVDNSGDVEVTFEEIAVIDQILKKSPLKFNDLTFPIIKKRKLTQARAESEEVEEKTIEVHGVPTDMDLENVRLYFENPRKSGGGRITGDLKRHEITGTVLITFASSEDAIQVVKRREHKIDSQKFEVNIYRGSRGKQFFLSEVKSDLSGDTIINFLEPKANIYVKSVVKMEGENTWFVFCEDFVNFSQVQQLCEKHTLPFISDTYPKVTPVPATDTILVKNVPQGLEEEMIQLYFQGLTLDVKSKTKLSADQLLITFNKSSVVPEMCQKTHSVMGTQLPPVIPYYKMQQIDGNYEDYELDSSSKLELMKKYKDNVEKMLQSHLKPIWSQSNGDVLKIQFRENSNKENGLKILRDLLKNMHVEIIGLSSPEMIAKAEQLIKEQYSSAIVLLDSVYKTLSIAAFSKAILLRIKEDLMSAGLSIGSESQRIPMESYKVALMFLENFPQKTQEKYPGVLIEKGTDEIIIKGRASNFSEVERDVYKFLSHIQSNSVTLSKHASRLLRNQEVKGYIAEKLKAQRCTASWDNKDSDLIIIYALKAYQLPIASDIFKSSIKALDFSTEDHMKDIRNHEKWKVFWQSIQTDHSNLFYLDEVTLIGVTIDSIEDEIKDKFKEFFHRNVRIEKLISLEKEQVDYLKERKMQDIFDFCQNFGTENPVIITIRPDNQLSITASVKNMNEAEDFIKDIIKKFKDTMEYFQTKNDKKKKPGENLSSIFQFKYANQMINIYEGDMTQLPVDAIVNAANKEMEHGGGVAKAIVDKGGLEIQTESKEMLAQQNLKSLPVGEAIITSGGVLPCQYIIHAVGPVWNGGNNDEEKLLSRAVKKSLRMAESKSLGSIAFPAISAGSYKYPLAEAVKVMTSAVKKYLDKNPLTTLTSISFVDTRKLVTSEFERQIKQVFFPETSEKNKISQKSSSETSGKNKESTKSDPKNSRAASPNSALKTETTTKTIIILREELQNMKADVIVNSISNDLDFKKGKLSQAILQSAGNELGNACKKFSALTIFQIIITKGYKLRCSNIFHISLPYCKENASMIVRKYTKKCLQAADNCKASSIAFPSLGTGQLDYPTAEVAEVMIMTIYDYLNKASTSLKEVYVAIHPKDDNVFKTFDRESDDLKKNTGVNVNSEKKKITLEISPKDTGKTNHGKTSTENYSAQLNAQGLPAQDVTRPDFFLGGVQIFIKNGDLLDEQTDVIVHCTDAKFGLRGAISKCLSQKCGQIFNQDCQKRASEMAKNHYALTNAHNLKCEMILHLDIVSKLSEPEKILETCFKVTEKYMISSLSIPQLATDGKNVPLGEMAAALNQVISKLKSPFLKRVNVVLYQAGMVAEMKKAFDSAEKGFSMPTTMKPTDVFKMITLQTTDAEYKKVEKEFLAKLQRTATIRSIEKVNNRPLKMQYDAQIAKMNAVNPPGTKNEHILWHGTKADCVMKICKDGFDRGYCGINGVALGQGVYFALHSATSDSHVYSPPDQNGNKHMLMCNVGTGVSIRGSSAVKVLPTRPNSNLKYDSTSDNPANPQVWVIFSDVQAYPAYHVSYR